MKITQEKSSIEETQRSQINPSKVMRINLGQDGDIEIIKN